MIVEEIYAPTAKDLISGIRQARYYVNLGATPAAATAVSVAAPAVPPDTARFITLLTMQSSPGAAQFFEIAQFIVVAAGGTSNSFFAALSPHTRNAAVSTGVALPCDILLLPGDVLLFQGQFNAGVANNAFSCSAFGYDIPRANLV